MKELKFKEYDRGNVRAYFKHENQLYCIQPGNYYLPELMACSRDGEPSHQVGGLFTDTDNGVTSNYAFINMPPDGDTWTWIDILAYFNSTDITSNGQLMKRMNELFECE